MGKARDKMWAYCQKNAENNTITCRFCQKNFTGGITPMKYHWAKMNGYSAAPCMNVKDEVNWEAVEAINLIKKESQMRSSMKVRTDIVPLQSYKVSSFYHEEVLDVVAEAGVKPSDFAREMDEATDSDSNGDKGYVLNACHQSDLIGSDTGTSSCNCSEPGIPRGKRSRLTSGCGEKSIEKDEDEIKFVKQIKFESTDHGNTNNRDNLYNLIVSCYGPLHEGNSPPSLGQVCAVMTDGILKMIPEIVKTKPTELSAEILEDWEGVVEGAAGLKFNVGWLGDIVTKMRRHFDSNVKVKSQEERVESLKKNVVSLEEELDKARKDLQIACSDLEKLKSFEVSELFKFDCKKL